jgi:hypothetical protein
MRRDKINQLYRKQRRGDGEKPERLLFMEHDEERDLVTFYLNGEERETVELEDVAETERRYHEQFDCAVLRIPKRYSSAEAWEERVAPRRREEQTRR